MKQSTRKHMKTKYHALRIIFVLLGLFNVSLSTPAFAEDMGMGNSMGNTGQQPITDELAELRAKVARLEAALENNQQGKCSPKQQMNMDHDKMGMKGMDSHKGHDKGMQMKDMDSPPSGNAGQGQGQGMGMGMDKME
jgi:hypothetical protein